MHSSRKHTEDIEGTSEIADAEVLSAMDCTMAKVFVSIAFKFDSLLNAAVVKAALDQTLKTYPALSGRYRKGSITDTIVHFSEGAEFVFVTAEEQEVHDYKSSADWTSTGALFTPIMMSKPSKDEPLLRVRLTHFTSSKISVLAVLVNHAVADMSSMSTFMLAWSKNCKGSKYPNDMPPKPQPLNHRRKGFKFTKLELPACIEDLKFGGIYEGFTPIDRFWFPQTLPRLIYRAMRYRNMHIGIPNDDVQKWKLRVNENKSEDEKVSGFELVQAMLFYATAMATGICEKSVFAVINTRSRITDEQQKLKHVNYFGNLVSGTRFQLKMAENGNNMEPFEVISKLASNFHAAMTSAKNKLDYFKYEFKAMNHLQDEGFNSRLCWPAISDIAKDKGVLLNSWRFPLLDIDMGSGTRASQFIVPESFAMAGMAIIMPHTHDEQAVQIVLRKDQAHRFLETIKTTDLPFYLVE